MPRSAGRGGTNVGLAARPESQERSAVSSPTTKPSGAAATWNRTRSRPRRARSATARVNALRSRTAPSETRHDDLVRADGCGSERQLRRARGEARNRATPCPLRLSGSPSVPFATTNFLPPRAATARSFVAHREPGAAASGEPARLDEVDQLVRRAARVARRRRRDARSNGTGEPSAWTVASRRGNCARGATSDTAMRLIRSRSLSMMRLLARCRRRCPSRGRFQIERQRQRPPGRVLH